MNNTDIDTLSGRELDAAVAIELGWRWMQPRMAEGIALYTEDEIADHDLIEPRITERLEMWDDGVPSYSADIAAAWELDGEGWDWQITDCIEASTGQREIKILCDCPEKLAQYVKSYVTVADFPTKAVATATARCRAWLKAKYAEKGVDNGNDKN